MTKHNFKQVRQEQGITAQQVAETAGVTLGVEYIFEIGGLVPTVTRESIVAAFSTLTGHDYCLDDFEEPKIPALPPVPISSRRRG